jgi:molybdate transport repressor ModE-like protein
MRLDLNLVEVFCCVVEEGSFSKAAKKLSLSQPTVSGHIKNLEAFVGAPLLDRLPRQIRLTRAGQVLHRHGQAILQEKGAAIRALKRLANRSEGTLVLCGSTIPAEYLMPPVVAGLHRNFPGIKIEIRISDSKGACDDVLAGRVELGLVGAKFEAVGLTFQPFASDELALVVPNTQEWEGKNSITLEELSHLPFLSRESGSGTRLAFERMLGRPIENLNVVGSFGSTNAIKEALKASLGVSILSILAVRWELASGLLKVVKIENIKSMRREFYIVFNKKLSLSPIAESFLQYVSQTISPESTLTAPPVPKLERRRDS